MKAYSFMNYFCRCKIQYKIKSTIGSTTQTLQWNGSDYFEQNTTVFRTVEQTYRQLFYEPKVVVVTTVLFHFITVLTSIYARNTKLNKYFDRIRRWKLQSMRTLERGGGGEIGEVGDTIQTSEQSAKRLWETSH